VPGGRIRYAALAAVGALALAAAAVAAAAPPGAAPPVAPPALVTFGGLDSRQLEGVNPADVQVAVGPTAVVQTVNSSIGIWSTAGQPLRNQTLAAFFSGGGVDRSQDTMTDPRVLWDPQSGRFFGAVFDVSRIELVIGLSLTADPLGLWSVYSLPSSGCPDQPRLGTSDTLVVITDDLFSSCRGRGRFLGGEVNVLNKQDLLAGAAAPRRTSFGPDARFAAITPAVSLTSTPVAYLSAVSSTGDGIQLIGIDTATVSSLPFRTIRLASALSGADQVPQRGGFQPLDAGDERIQNAVFDDGRLWLTASESCAGNRACGRVIGIDAVNARLLQESSVSLPADRSLIYPAVAPDSRGNVVVGFVFSSTADFAGLGYTYVRPDGVVASPRDLVAGTATNTSGRFGDYSGAARDPSDPAKIWLGAEIGQAPNGTSLGWGTGISAVRVPPQAPAVAATKTAGPVVSAEVYPEGAATGYRVEYGPTTAYGSRTAAATVAATVRSQIVTVPLGGLAPGATYHARVVTTSANGTSAGADVTFRTPPGKPQVAYPAHAATKGAGAVTLRALVSGGGSATSVVFEYGPTRAYGARTAVRRVGGGSVRTAVSTRVEVAAGRLTHFRAVATNAKGKTAGPDRVVRG
jgi:hypothetical protein